MNITPIPFDLSSPGWGLYAETYGQPAPGDADYGSYVSGPRISVPVKRGPKTIAPGGGPLVPIRKIGEGGIADLLHNVFYSVIEPAKTIQQRQREGRGIGSGFLLRVGVGLGLGIATGYGSAWAISAYSGWTAVGVVGGIALTGFGVKSWMKDGLSEEKQDQIDYAFYAGSALGGGYYYKEAAAQYVQEWKDFGYGVVTGYMPRNQAALDKAFAQADKAMGL